jgi:hypothetical protein
MLNRFATAQNPCSRYDDLVLACLLVLVLSVFFVLAVCEPTQAAVGTQALQEGGTNVGNALLAWGKALLFAVAALMGIGALVNRSVGEGVTILIIVLILGAFLYDQADTEAVIRNVWGAVGG